MRNTFINNEYQQELEKYGYVVHNHGQTDIIQKINHLYHQYSSEHQQYPFTTSHFSVNKKYKENLFQISKEIYEQHFASLFDEYELIFSNLMIKHPNADNHLPMHADWSYVDEKKYRAISIWLPTIDTNEQNGILGVIPKSHLLCEEMRGPEIISVHRKFDSIIQKQHGVLLPISNQQALIYDLRLQHFSLPNFTNHTRIAINIVIVPKASKIHHYIRKEDKILRYDHLNKDFYLVYNAHQIPDHLQPSATFPIEHNISEKDIIDFYQIQTSSPKRDLWRKIRHFFQ